MADKFLIGTTVKLKAGGPEMSVKSLPSQMTGNSYTCQWFAGKKLEQGHFAEATLELAPAKTQK